MITGAYAPETSGGAVVCRDIIGALRGEVTFLVLTTSHDRTLPTVGSVDGVMVYRIFATLRRGRTNILTRVRAALQLVVRFIQLRRQFDIVHIHGCSPKAVLVTLMASLCRKKLLLTLHNGGLDEAHAVREKGRLAFWAYCRADHLTAVSRALQQSCRAEGLPVDKVTLVPNTVDLGRFRPGDVRTRVQLRRELGLPQDFALLLFVGYFSDDKCPDVVFDAWKRLAASRPDTALVFIGSTSAANYHVNPDLVIRILDEVRRLDVTARVVFVEGTHNIEKYFGAADVFALPSVREGCPIALLEAMATALPCVASRLPGVTDTVIDDGVNGVLVPPRDVAALARALEALFGDPNGARQMGAKARATIEQRHTIGTAAPQYLRIYRHLLSGSAVAT